MQKEPHPHLRSTMTHQKVFIISEWTVEGLTYEKEKIEKCKK
jgi:hypothetical protein